MTVSVQTTFTASVASGASTVFPYGFKIAHADDLTVTVDGAEQTAGFSVTNVGYASGGDVVFDVAPTAGAKIVRYLNPILKRETDYQQFGDWMASVVNLDMDRLWLAMQMLAQNTSRSLKLPVDTAINQEITQDAATRANKGFKFDGDGNLTLSLYDPDDAQVASTANVIAAQAAADAAAAIMSAFVEGSILSIENGGTGADTAAGARAALGLGTAATKGVGTSDGQLVEVQTGGKLPALSAEDLTSVPLPGAGTITPEKLTQKLTRGTAVSAASGTSISFTSVPSWVKRITIVPERVSVSGTVAPLIRLGTGGVLEVTGYEGTTTSHNTTAMTAAAMSVSGFDMTKDIAAANVHSGSFGLFNVDGNTWVIDGGVAAHGGAGGGCKGSKTLAGVLDTVAIVMPTTAFDGGKFNIFYEG